MKKATKWLAVALAVALFVGLAVSNLLVEAATESHTLPVGGVKPASPNIPMLPDGSKINIDGDLKEWPTAARYAVMNKANLLAGPGSLWNDEIEGTDPKEYTDPATLTADCYMYYDSKAIYLAWKATYDKHENTEKQPDLIWKGSCVQVQMSTDRDKNRNEFGFALSTWGSKLPMSYCWFGATSATQAVFNGLSNKKNQDGYYIVRDNATKSTLYEARIPLTAISATKTEFKSGDKLYFACAFKVEGGFYEWAAGVVGGTDQKLITDAAVMNLGTSVATVGKVGATTTPPVTITTPPTTVTTKPPVDSVTTKPPVDSVTTPPPVGPGTTTKPITTATTVPTTTMSIQADAPLYNIVPGEEIGTEDAAYAAVAAKVSLSVAENLLKMQPFAKEADASKQYAQMQTPGEDDNFKGVYYVSADDKVTELKAVAKSQAQTALGANYQENVSYYDTSKLKDTDKLFVVYEVEPTTAPPEDDLTEPVEGDETDAPTSSTTKATEAVDATTTEGTDDGGSLLWLWILIAVVVLAGAGVAVFFVLKKKGDADEA